MPQMETDLMTYPHEYLTRWPNSVTAMHIAADVTELYQSRLRENGKSISYRRVAFAESLLLTVLRITHQGEG